MGFLKSHQHTAVTSIINDCCQQNELNEDDYYIETQLSSLLDAIKNQKDFVEPGATEAARALRKKMKYGNIKDQFNSLKILDLLVINGIGLKCMKPLFNDDKLLDRLQNYLLNENDNDNINIDESSKKINKKLSDLTYKVMLNWYNEFGDYPDLENINLVFERCEKKRNLQKKRKQSSSSKIFNNQVPDFMNDEADMNTPFNYYDDNDKPRTNAELDKEFKIPKINYDKEAPKILQLIAEANIMSTNLSNVLNLLQKDELSIHSIKANDAFDQCRSIRRKILRYLQLVQREELLGPLLKCNDELVDALKKYEIKSVPSGTKIHNGDTTDSTDYDSLADYESDVEPVQQQLRVKSSSQSYISSSNDEDSSYDRDRVIDEEPPSRISRSTRTSTSNSTLSYKEKKAPPPVPPKSSILKSPKINKLAVNIPQRTSRSDYDPFSDDNEVAPSRWG
jgi:hypothetical protein